MNCKDRMCGAADCLTCHPEAEWPRPMRDMEEEIIEIADEIAERDYERSFYDLNDTNQDKVLQLATQEWQDRMASKAESLEDR